MGIGRVAYWLPLLAGYSAGQLVIQAINLATGFLILRLLSIDEYAIYILASLLQSVATLGSDLGVSQGVVSIGAPIRDDRSSMGALVRNALVLRRRLFAVVVPVVVAVAYFLFRGNASGIELVIAVTLLALANAWAQQSATVAIALLNAHHDSSALVRAGLVHALSRLLLVGTLCSALPFSVTALAINLAGALLHSTLLWHSGARHLARSRKDSRDFRRELVEFTVPLVPGIVYYLVQGQLATFLLALGGATVSVAEVGALGRLGQIIALLGLLNGFFIQPYFARIADRCTYIRRAAQVGVVVCIAFGVITASVAFAPAAWLAILGPQYEGLGGELLIAAASAQLSVAGAIVYTIVISTRRTRGQWLQIVLGLGAQIAYIAFVGVQSTAQALVVNLLPAAGYLVLQLGLLVRVVLSWNPNARGE